MKLEQYYKFMEDPRLLNNESLKSLEELVKSYPYVENFRILYALNLLLVDDFKYQDHLHKAALYASDRKKLKYWVNYLQHEIEEDLDEGNAEILEAEPIAIPELPKTVEPKKEVKEEESKEPISTPIQENKEIDPPVINRPKESITLSEAADPKEIEKQSQNTKTKSELLKLVKKRLAEIESEKSKNQEEQGDIEDQEDTQNFKANLIDRFIESQPSISRPDKTEFFNPQKEAIDSTLDDDDFFVTETLAHIHVQQGNFKKAIEIYRKLILKIPEKSTYFAAQIEELSRK